MPCSDRSCCFTTGVASVTGQPELQCSDNLLVNSTCRLYYPTAGTYVLLEIL
jgi:hypothetical protein